MSQRRFRKRQPKKKLSKADQALRLAKSNKRKIADTREISVSPTTLGSTVMSSTPQILYLQPAGTDGSKVKVTSFQIKGVIKQDLASAIIDDYRVDLVLDRYPAKLILTAISYLDATNPTILDFKTFAAKERFKILKTWSGYLSSSEGSNSFRKFNDYIRINHFSEGDDSFDQDQVTKNALYLVRWTTASANQPLAQFKARLYSVTEA